mgnify:CR=1 FL=1
MYVFTVFIYHIYKLPTISPSNPFCKRHPIVTKCAWIVDHDIQGFLD